MLRHLVAGAASTAMCLSAASPARAQEAPFTGLQGPQGASATLNFRIPLDGRARRERPSVGLTLSFGQVRQAAGAGETLPAVRQMRMADLRFDRGGLARAEFASFDLAHLDQEPRLAIGENKKSIFWVLLVAGVAGVALLLSDDGYSSSQEDDDPETTPNPGGQG